MVKLEDIGAIKVHKKAITRIVGGGLITFGVSLAFASTVAVLYRDRSQNYPIAYGTSAATFLAGRYLVKRKKLKLGEKYRLRIIEIKFQPGS